MILVLIDHDLGQLDPLSLRALTAARKLDSDIEAVVVGDVGEHRGVLAASVGEYGAKTLYLASHANLIDYAPRASGKVLVELVAKLKPVAVLAVASSRGNEQLAHLSAFLNSPMASDCMSITLSSAIGQPHQVLRARWAGNLIENANVYSDILLATIFPFSVEAESVSGAPATISEFEPSLDAKDTRVQILSRDSGGGKSGGVTLTDAKVIVSGGRGVGGPDGFGILEELAELLGGTVGCSRVVTSSGWRPHAEQVGQTGTKVSPDLYIAAGISGAIQHIAGMKNSKTIVVINTDPEAPILNYADYAIIGDLHKIIPALNAAVREAKNNV
jgi:electron transfer flavoprotein alpha subunit